MSQYCGLKYHDNIKNLVLENIVEMVSIQLQITVLLLLPTINGTEVAGDWSLNHSLSSTECFLLKTLVDGFVAEVR